MGAAPKKENEKKEAGAREESEMSRLPCFACRIKRKGPLMSASIWSFGSQAEAALAALVDIHITLKD